MSTITIETDITVEDRGERTRGTYKVLKKAGFAITFDFIGNNSSFKIEK